MNWLNSIFILAVAFLTVFLQAWTDLYRDLFGAQINLLPALMVYTSLTNGIATIALLAVLGGLWFDSLSMNPLGASILPLFVIGFLLYRKRDLLLREHTYAQFILGLSASLLVPLLTLFLLLNLGSVPLLSWKTVWHLLVISLGGGIVTPVCFHLFDRIHRALNYQPFAETSFRPDRQIKRGRN
jgi:cell shape-determining protein MreD